jgi:hypothetical protein
MLAGYFGQPICVHRATGQSVLTFAEFGVHATPGQLTLHGKEALLKKILLLLIIVFLPSFSSCLPAEDDDFAIYLLAQDIPVRELSQTDIGQFVLETEPVISGDDIVSYDKTSHSIELTQAAFNRIQQLFPVPVEVDGIPFVVCVGREQIYAGAFWTPRSAINYDGVVIMQPFDAGKTIIQIALGYPVSEVFTGTDPRADPRILKALEHNKKLK